MYRIVARPKPQPCTARYAYLNACWLDFVIRMPRRMLAWAAVLSPRTSPDAGVGTRRPLCRAGAWCMISMQAEPRIVRTALSRQTKRKRNTYPTGQRSLLPGRGLSVGKSHDEPTSGTTAELMASIH